MTITTIKVQGYDIALEMSCSVPIAEWESFKQGLDDCISDALYDQKTEGTIPMYYTEGGNDSDEEGYDVDVDVKWKIIDWRGIARVLYEELSGCILHVAEVNASHWCAQTALDVYDNTIKYYSNGDSNK